MDNRDRHSGEERRADYTYDRRMAENRDAMGAVGQRYHIKWVENPENENLRDYNIRTRRTTT